jgi:hypothetical protein
VEETRVPVKTRDQIKIKIRNGKKLIKKKLEMESLSH